MEIILEHPLISAASTRIITIGTIATLVRVTSGNFAMDWYNAGPTEFWFGGSTVAMNSGIVVWTQSTKEWRNMQGDFGVFCIANSASTQLIVVDYD